MLFLNKYTKKHFYLRPPRDIPPPIDEPLEGAEPIPLEDGETDDLFPDITDEPLLTGDCLTVTLVELFMMDDLLVFVPRTSPIGLPVCPSFLV
jgi:hypothetical protein